MSLGKTVTLSSGQKLPTLGFGTWQSEPGKVGTAVYEALKAGYRHLDLAKIYENQKEVGKGIKKAYADVPGLQREDIFITSKLWNTQHKPEDVEPALDDTLAELDLEYLDLYLIHWPCVFDEKENPHSQLFPPDKNSKWEHGEVLIDDNVPLSKTWEAMTKLPKSKTRAVGVSNFSIEHIEAVIKATGVVPVVNQVERHPVLSQAELIKYTDSKNIHITSYSAFGNNAFDVPLLITRPEIKEVAESASKRTGKEVTPAQVILAWAQAGGHSVIPKSVTPSRIQQNFQEVELTDEELKKVVAIGEKEKRRYNIPYTANKPRWDVNIFEEEEEKPATHKIVV